MWQLTELEKGSIVPLPQRAGLSRLMMFPAIPWGQTRQRRWKVPKQSPVPSDLDKPFYDACNQERLVVQYCTACSRFQFPPRAICPRCSQTTNLEWRQVSGRGRIRSYVVVHDTPSSSLIPDQPFNVALISLEEEPQVVMLSHLPGTPVGQVPIGAAVQVIFETTPATGQKVPEWRVVG